MRRDVGHGAHRALGDAREVRAGGGDAVPAWAGGAAARACPAVAVRAEVHRRLRRRPPRSRACGRETPARTQAASEPQPTQRWTRETTRRGDPTERAGRRQEPRRGGACGPAILGTMTVSTPSRHLGGDAPASTRAAGGTCARTRRVRARPDGTCSHGTRASRRALQRQPVRRARRCATWSRGDARQFGRDDEGVRGLAQVHGGCPALRAGGRRGAPAGAGWRAGRETDPSVQGHRYRHP